MIKYGIVGGGLAGTTMAYLLKQKSPESKVTLYEKENSIGGLCRTFSTAEGINYELGPHVLYSDLNELKDFFEHFFKIKEKKYYQYLSIDGSLKNPYHFPVTTQDIIRFDPKAAAELYHINLENIDFSNFENYLISRIGKTAYEIFFKNYNIKQWKIHPKHMECEWAKQRRMILRDFVEPVFGDKWQGHPGSYTPLFEKLTKDIQIINEKVLKISKSKIITENSVTEYDFIINTAPIDLIFGEQNSLEYRGICWVFAILNIDYALPTYLMSFPNNYNFTRIMEYKHQSQQELPGITLISFDFPFDSFHEKDFPTEEYVQESKCFLNKFFLNKIKKIFTKRKNLVYPVSESNSLKNFWSIIDHVSEYSNIITLGRLGLYSYISMDTCIAQCQEALLVVDNWNSMSKEERVGFYKKLRNKQT